MQVSVDKRDITLKVMDLLILQNKIACIYLLQGTVVSALLWPTVHHKVYVQNYRQEIDTKKAQQPFIA